MCWRVDLFKTCQVIRHPREPKDAKWIIGTSSHQLSVAPQNASTSASWKDYGKQMWKSDPSFSQAAIGICQLGMECKSVWYPDPPNDVQQDKLCIRPTQAWNWYAVAVGPEKASLPSDLQKREPEMPLMLNCVFFFFVHILYIMQNIGVCWSICILKHYVSTNMYKSEYEYYIDNYSSLQNWKLWSKPMWVQLPNLQSIGNNPQSLRIYIITPMSDQSNYPRDRSTAIKNEIIAPDLQNDNTVVWFKGIFTMVSECLVPSKWWFARNCKQSSVVARLG